MRCNNADPNTEVVVAPPSLYLLLTREHLSDNIAVAAQNVFDRPNGAFTGEISVAQLKDSNITWTLVGHSERRTILREEDEFVACKTKAALDGGIGVILCVGESLEQREAGTTVDVVTKQLAAVNNSVGKDGWANIVIAYEPIWAIGTGKVATTGKSRPFGEVHSSGANNGGHRTSTGSACCHSKVAQGVGVERGGRGDSNHLWWQCDREEQP